MNMLAPLALALAFLAGFALQRGNICAVAAVREGVEEGDWRRFLALSECAAWALLGLLLAAAFGLMPLRDWPAQPSLVLAIFGGALFGAGALVNGACAMGTIGRLGAGEFAFLAMPAGFVLGAVGAYELGARAGRATTAAFMGPAFALLLAALCLFALFRVWTALHAAPSAAVVKAAIAAPRWAPALAMAVIAFANVALFAVIVSWPYTTLLVDVARGSSRDWALRSMLAIALVVGAVVGAASAGRFAWRMPSLRAFASCFAGGVLMGLGGALIPGGNDALVLIGLPLLQTSAFAAYGAMMAAIAAGFLARRYRTV